MLLFSGKWKTKFKIGKQFGPLINLKYMLILSSKLHFKIEKRKLMTDFRFSGGRKTNGFLIHAFILSLRTSSRID